MFKIRLISIISCLILLSMALFPATVFAAVSMSPSQGIVGNIITITGLTSGQNYTIKWDGVNLVTGTVPAGGAVTFGVPEDFGGIHDIVVESPTSTSVLTESYTILPSISIDPIHGKVGTAVEVKGKGFTESEEDVEVLYDDDTVKADISANSSGSWSATFNVPDSATGDHDVDASGADTTASSVDDKTFTIEPAISIDPTSCVVGCSVTVTGTGFADSETAIKVIFGGTEVRTGINANSKGSWNTSFNVPNIYSGSHEVDAYGDETDAADVTNLTFSVISGIALDKTSGYVSDVIAVTGTGFAANETGIYITFDGINQGSAVSADSTGQWKSTLSIPPATNGNHIVDAHGSSTTAGSISDKDFTVEARLIISPSEGNVGDQISLNGTGFTGSTTVTIKYGNLSVLNASTDSTGNFGGSFDAPKGMSGDIEVVATDSADITASALFAMDKVAPEVPQIVSPEDGEMVGLIGDTRVTYKWKDVDDPSGVTYSIQVATDSSFEGIVLEHTGLTSAEYKSMSDEALSPGEYYWRVRAVDYATNTSDWSRTTNFKAGFMSIGTLIIIIAVIALVILVIIRVRIAFFKKRTKVD